MKTPLDISTWNRRPHFELFNSFTEPMFGVTVTVDCTAAYQKARELGVSFFIYYLYQSMVAANHTEPFRYRIENNREVFIHDVVSAGPTIGRPDGTFGFAYLEFYPALLEFAQAAQPKIDAVKQSNSLFPVETGANIIHYSTLPALNFTSLSHPRNFSDNTGIPKITFGQVTETGGRRQFPVSVTVHHGLMDGWHVSRYVQLYQELMNS